MSDAIDDIRKRYAEATATHECTIRTITCDEFRALPIDGRFGDWCVTVITDRDGKQRMSTSKGCGSIVDKEWVDDVAVLLARIDELEDNLTGLRDWPDSD